MSKFILKFLRSLLDIIIKYLTKRRNKKRKKEEERGINENFILLHTHTHTT
jgi:hypothetical protein